MPAQPKKAAAPKASRKKRAAFTFHLLQPFFQFAALLLVLLAFTRCSPLSPSTEKAGYMQGSGGGNAGGTVAFKAAALEQAIQSSLHELSTREAKLVSETDFRANTEDVKSADDAIDERATKSIFDRRDGAGMLTRKPKILFLTLSPEQTQAVLKEGKVRLNLSDRLSGARGGARSLLVRHLKSEQKRGKLDATGYLVMPDSVMKRGAAPDLSLELVVSFGAPSEEESYLEISRGETEETDATLLEAALRDLSSLAIVLE